MNVVFHDDALAEYLAAVVWYERYYSGRGYRFRTAVERTLMTIAREPLSFPERLGHRVALVSRFPYLLAFDVLDDTRIRVLAVAHVKRQPGYWRSRGR